MICEICGKDSIEVSYFTTIKNDKTVNSCKMCPKCYIAMHTLMLLSQVTNQTLFFRCLNRLILQQIADHKDIMMKKLKKVMNELQ
jgi:hypothetical protein